jgi:hypothetical protein
MKTKKTIKFIKFLPNGAFEFRSVTSGKTYTMFKKQDDEWSCTCPHNVWRRKGCGHLDDFIKNGVNEEDASSKQDDFFMGDSV